LFTPNHQEDVILSLQNQVSQTVLEIGYTTSTKLNIHSSLHAESG